MQLSWDGLEAKAALCYIFLAGEMEPVKASPRGRMRGIEDRPMRKPTSVRGAEEFGRVRLSRTFFMRDFLHSEIAGMNGMTNLPDDPDLAISAGRRLCEELLEPLQATFGRIAIRSAYRSPEVNGYGNLHNLSCASNESGRGGHIWDQRSKDGAMGAMTTIVVPWLVDRIGPDVTWVSMAWWVHDHLPYSELQFFPKLTAFNISWSERPKKRITSFMEPRGLLTKRGYKNQSGNHRELYPGFPALIRPDPFFATEETAAP